MAHTLHEYAARFESLPVSRPMVLTASNLSRSHAARTLFRGVDFRIESGERVALIGPNGGGKTTILRMLAGLEETDTGKVTTSRGVRVIHVPQHDHFAAGATVRAIAAMAAIESASVHGDHHEAEVLGAIILGKMGFADAQLDQAADLLPGGWRKRLSIACGLARADGAPELLLLDEPTNHLDVSGIEWLESLLRRGSSDLRADACVFVSHDRAFIRAVATRVVELNPAFAGGSLSVDGGYDEFVRRRAETLQAQSRAQTTLSNEVRQDDKWLARGAQARRTKAKFRIEDSAARRDDLGALAERNAAAAASGPSVDFSSSGRRTRRLIQAIGISKAFGSRPLFQDLDLELGPGVRLGLMGANGSGKTTLIKILCGELAPDSGSLRLADPPPRIVILRQNRREIPPTTLLGDAISPGGEMVHFRDRTLHIKAWSRMFLFRDEQLLQPLSTLSGGENARVHMARMMLEPADVLVLDEPTNDLDIPTLEVLEESIESFPGAVVLVTHDRAMLARLATSIVVLGAQDGSTSVVTDLKQALAALARAQDAAGAEDSRSSKSAQPAVSSTVDSPSSGTSPEKKLRRLGFKEQRELDGIETSIEKAQKAVAAAERRIGEPSVLSDHKMLSQAYLELQEAQALEQSLYARWAELEARRNA